MSWGWCAGCQSLYSQAARENPWSCPAGGRHNRNVSATQSELRAGRYSLAEREAIESNVVEHGGPTVASMQVPVARWPLDVGTDDVLGERDTRVVRGGPTIEPSAESARFDGGGLEVVDPRFEVDRGELTVAWWMRADTEQPQNAVLFDLRDGIETISARERATHGFAILVNSGRLSVQLADGTTSQNYVIDDADVLPNPPRWLMVTVTMGETLHVFVDGTSVETVDADGLGSRSGASRDANGRSLFIGCHRVDGGPAYRGELADVQVFGQQLDQAEVSALYLDAAASRQPEPFQDGWLGCVACGCVVYREPGGATPTGCQALGSREHALDATVAYELEAPDGEAGHHGWARCAKCAVAFFAPFAASSACGAGGTHEVGERLPPLHALAVPDFAMVEPRRSGPRVLFLGANKRGHTVLELQTEKRYLEEATEQSSLDVRGLLNASLATIERELIENDPTIVQLSAHGTDSPDGAGLWLHGSDEPVSGDELGEMFRSTANGRDGGVKAVVLNACRSSGTATSIAAHVPYVIAVEDDIADEAAVFFTPIFYEQLALGRDVPAALDHARRQLIDVAHFSPDQVPALVPYSQEDPS